MIKLFKVEEYNGVLRLQSQMYIGGNTADFILEDEVIKYWGFKDSKLDFHKYTKPYIIVDNVEEICVQPL